MVFKHFKHMVNVDFMLGHRRRRLTYINPTLQRKHNRSTLAQCFRNVGTYIKASLQLEKEFPTQRPGFSLFECFRQKNGLIFCKHNCIVLPREPESQMSRI